MLLVRWAQLAMEKNRTITASKYLRILRFLPPLKNRISIVTAKQEKWLKENVHNPVTEVIR
ncbi:MAG TPA: hypothetical protein VJW20_24660, partial [Candidatus Angelobacter sp.]|nr:hypothetical protein [Candidatus Angelobacter sp.]